MKHQNHYKHMLLDAKCVCVCVCRGIFLKRVLFFLQELEKFKFVLDFKIKDLKQQVEPRELELQKTRDLVGKMETELGRLLLH